MGARQLRPLDEYEPTDDLEADPYGSYYVVLPEGSWEPEAREPAPAEPEPDDEDRPTRRAVGDVAGIATALVAGVIPALVLDLPAALVAGLAAGVFGGLMGRSLGIGFHHRGHGEEEG
ncbi:hypothetical protein [Umezawaea tangerina]|uniref:Uncharacterized protein n=1 Tax=Umezawaea tangerina TaxID=84725 RepID=A0A2T0TGF1_9PSEU|nr:hypothetical protein [Umezawaea tangerina]PRY44750.1 hypothetical protein CLV43_102315 [Umezawaea tangerina]